MANKLYNEDTIKSIANAIRAKNGTSTEYHVSDMPTAIANINTNPAPSGTVNITTNGVHEEIAGKAKAIVNVPSDVYEPNTIVANGTYTPTGHAGFSKVVVNINDAPELQNKTVTATEFPCEVIPDTGYYGLNKATVNYTPPTLQSSKSATVTYGQSVTVTPDENYDAIESVTVTATEPSGNINITENGTVNIKQYAQATVNVQPEISLQDKTVTTNGNVTADAGYTGLGTVTVNVPQPSGTINITENGTVDVTQYASANVQVQSGITRIERGSGKLTISNNTITITHTLGFVPSFIIVSPPEDLPHPTSTGFKFEGCAGVRFDGRPHDEGANYMRGTSGTDTFQTSTRQIDYFSDRVVIHVYSSVHTDNDDYWWIVGGIEPI